MYEAGTKACWRLKRNKALRVKLFKISLEWSFFHHSSIGKESACNAGDASSIPGSGRSPGEGIGYRLQYTRASLVAQLVKNLPAMQETWVQSLGWEDALEKRKATHSSLLSWRIQRTVHGVAKSRTRLHECTHQAPLFMGFSRQEYWSGLPSARLLCPWTFPGKNIGVGCRYLVAQRYLGSLYSLLVERTSVDKMRVISNLKIQEMWPVSLGPDVTSPLAMGLPRYC